MAHRFEKGKPIYFLFKNGYTVQDSQLKPRYYLDRKKAEEYLPYGDEIVEYAPTIEAEPVRHGKWLGLHDGWYYSYSCSECGAEALTKEETMHDQVCSAYCHNCGAKMEKEE